MKKRANRGRTPSGEPNPVDMHVGARVRMRRTLMGMSQEQLGRALGMAFQQVQKYENGGNRIASSRLYDLSRVLDVPIGYFFDDMPDDTKAQCPGLLVGAPLETPPPPPPKDPMARRETIELVRAYHRITDPQVRKQVYDLARVLGGAA